MPALEIWTNACGGVMLRDSETGECRELKGALSVTFVDGSAFPKPASAQAQSGEVETIRTLSGQSVRVGQ